MVVIIQRFNLAVDDPRTKIPLKSKHGFLYNAGPGDVRVFDKSNQDSDEHYLEMEPGDDISWTEPYDDKDIVWAEGKTSVATLVHWRKT